MTDLVDIFDQLYESAPEHGRSDPDNWGVVDFDEWLKNNTTEKIITTQAMRYLSDYVKGFMLEPAVIVDSKTVRAVTRLSEDFEEIVDFLKNGNYILFSIEYNPSVPVFYEVNENLDISRVDKVRFTKPTWCIRVGDLDNKED